MRIEALIFDIGNVLVAFDWQPFRNQLLAGSVNLTAEAEMKFRELVIRFDLGEMNGEIFARLATRLIGFQRRRGGVHRALERNIQFKSADGANHSQPKEAIPSLSAFQHFRSASGVFDAKF